MQDKEVIDLIKRGDKAAMRQLYDRHIRYLTAVAQRYLGYDAVRDVLQESFLKIFSSIDRFEYRSEGGLRAWMARIVVTESLKHLRREGPPMQSLDAVPLAEVEEEPTEGIPIEVLHRMIRELPAGYRAVFNLYVVEGRSHREIASMLGIGESSSASQLHRAKSLLARNIKEYKEKNSLML